MFPKTGDESCNNNEPLLKVQNSLFEASPTIPLLLQNVVGSLAFDGSSLDHIYKNIFCWTTNGFMAINDELITRSLYIDRKD